MLYEVITDQHQHRGIQRAAAQGPVRRDVITSYSIHYTQLYDAATRGDLVSLWSATLELLSASPSGAWLDIGCSVGRGTFELAVRTRELTLGLDLSFAMLRIARDVLIRNNFV